MSDLQSVTVRLFYLVLQAHSLHRTNQCLRGPCNGTHRHWQASHQ